MNVLVESDPDAAAMQHITHRSLHIAQMKSNPNAIKFVNRLS